MYSAGQGLTTLIEFTMSMKNNQEDVTPQIEEEKIAPNVTKSNVVEATIDDQYSRDTSRLTSVHAQLINRQGISVIENNLSMSVVEKP